MHEFHQFSIHHTRFLNCLHVSNQWKLLALRCKHVSSMRSVNDNMGTVFISCGKVLASKLKNEEGRAGSLSIVEHGVGWSGHRQLQTRVSEQALDMAFAGRLVHCTARFLVEDKRTHLGQTREVASVPTRKVPTSPMQVSNSLAVVTTQVPTRRRPQYTDI